MPIEKIRPSWTFDAEKIEELKRIAPECFTDGVINWEVLKESLGEYLEEDNPDIEHFGLFWPGKREARRIASQPSKGTLIPVPGEGVDEDKTKNIFIEGENLEVLKLLQKSYAGKVKMIYIDPPYNTGNDFVYEDDFKESLEEYFKRTGQTDEQGKPLTTNKKADGRFHSKWLSMMYPRLRLARNLLREDGVIFVSIDDNEVHNLRQLMNEIFGEENFLVNIIWKSGRTSAGHFINENEYIIGFSRNKDLLPYFQFDGDDLISDRAIKRPSAKNPVSEITFPAGMEFDSDDKIFPNKFGEGEPVEVIQGIFEAKSKKLANEVTLKAAWTMKDMIVSWIDGDTVYDQKGQIVEKFFFKSNGVLQYQKQKGTIHPKSTISNITTKNGSNEIDELFGIKVFDFPKPTKLFKELILPILKNSNDLILDFFAGSGTLGHTIFHLNKEFKANHYFILVQIPEPVNNKEDSGKNAKKLGLGTVADITKERLRRARKKIMEEYEKEIEKKGEELAFEDADSSDIQNSVPDFGFKVFKLTKSNYKEWQDYTGEDIKQLENLFENSLDPLVPEWKEEDVLTETILIEGFPLDSHIELLEEYKSNKILLISSNFHEHKLIICLDKELKQETINEISIIEPDIFICLDSAITDEFKVRLQDKGRIKTI